MKFHPDVLAAHAQFGGDLESMQKCYDWCDLTKEVSRLKIEASKHAHDAETVRRQRDQFMRENQSFTDAVVTLWEALSKACEIMSAYKRAGHGDEVHMASAFMISEMVRRAMESGEPQPIDWSPPANHQMTSEEREAFIDKIEGLEADLDNAVEVAFKRGATEWCRLNYPAHFARLAAIQPPATTAAEDGR